MILPASMTSVEVLALIDRNFSRITVTLCLQQHDSEFPKVEQKEHQKKKKILGLRNQC